MDRLRRLNRRRLVVAAVVALLVVAGGCDGSDPTDLATELSPAAVRLQSYLQVDTTATAGDAQRAVELLAGWLEETPAQIEILDAGDGYPSLWAYLPPSEPRAEDSTLLLLHHLDVVDAEGRWDQPPFSGQVVAGELWGRGAIDSKSLGIAHLAAFIELAAADEPRQRGVALMAAADEERGGQLGVGRWLDERPELFASIAAVVNEGGFNRGHDGRLHWWGIETSQKRPLWLEATGQTEALIAGLGRLVERDYVWRVPPQAKFTFAQMAPHYNKRWQRLFLDLERFVEPSGPTVMLLPGMESFFLDSIQVNLLEVVDGDQARARVDVRLLPDTDRAALLSEIESLLGVEVALEVLLSSPPVQSSPWSGPWIDILHDELRSVAPIVPQMAAGTTDSRYFRQRGIAAYGFSPFILNGEFTRTVHSRNERIPVAEFERGVERMTRLVAAWAMGHGGSEPQESEGSELGSSGLQDSGDGSTL